LYFCVPCAQNLFRAKNYAEKLDVESPVLGPAVKVSSFMSYEWLTSYSILNHPYNH